LSQKKNPLIHKGFRTIFIFIAEIALQFARNYCIVSAPQGTPTTMNTTIKNSLPLTELGFIPSDRAKTFYRVESWNTGSFIADFASQSEAKSFAISDARAKGCRYDHKVCTMRMAGSR
jgi:hypothetical protein